MSILDYEPELSRHIDNLENSDSFRKIIRLLETGRINNIHIDVMRPPMIPKQTKFSLGLLRSLYENLGKGVDLVIHLMVNDPTKMIYEINEFIPSARRRKTSLIIQVESFQSEEESIEALKILRKFGYKAGICLNLPTPREALTKRIVENADMVLFMSVPMGQGGQKYCDEAAIRIKNLAEAFPDKFIEVDGGIDSDTILKVWKAGADAVAIGSFITRSDNPEETLIKLEHVLEKNCEEG